MTPDIDRDRLRRQARKLSDEELAGLRRRLAGRPRRNAADAAAFAAVLRESERRHPPQTERTPGQ